MQLISGLIVGLLLGIILKRGRFCPTGLIRDIYLEKKKYHIILILAIISIQGFLYHLMVAQKMIFKPSLGEFSLVGIALGSFIFGFGAVLANGCMTSTLVKIGDGRIVGFASLLTFMLTGYLASQGPLVKISSSLSGITMVKDNLIKKIPFSPAYIFGAVAIICCILMYRHYVKFKPKFALPSQYTGLKHIFMEKIWAREASAILIGILGAGAFLASKYFFRNGGFAISSPILSYVYLCTGLEGIEGG